MTTLFPNSAATAILDCMNSNLVPELRTDKNGKAVTRHLKQRVSSSSKALLSAVPRIGSSKLAKQQLSSGHTGRAEESAIRNPLSRTVHKFNRDKSTMLMAQLLFGHGREIHRYTDENLFCKDVGYVLSAQEVEKALALTMVLTRKSVPDRLADKDRAAIVDATLRPTSDQNCGQRMSRLSANVEWLEVHPGEAGKVVLVSDALGYENEDDGSPIGNLDSLVAVCDHTFLSDENHSQDMKRAYILAASQNPKQSVQIADYIVARNGFDEDGFREYMGSAMPLAGGSL